MRDEVATRRNFLTIYELFNYLLWRYSRAHSVWESIHIVRAEILNERQGYAYHSGMYIPRLVNSVRITDVFYGDTDVGDTIDIARVIDKPHLTFPIGDDFIRVGDDLILFLSVPMWEEAGKLVHSQGAFRTPPQLSYPQSIISSILTRTISEDMILEPLNPRNNLVLTIQDLARIAGLCDSPWPQPPTWQPEMYPYLVPHTEGFIEVEIRP